MLETIPEKGLEGKVCQQIDMGLLQEVIAPHMIEELLETYQMWEERERKTNMLMITYWLIALHLYPTLSQRRVYGKMVSGLRTTRDDVPDAIPARSAESLPPQPTGKRDPAGTLCAGGRTQSQLTDARSLLERDAFVGHRWHGGVGSFHSEQSRSLPLQQRR
jgi:hypothetical protein